MRHIEPITEFLKRRLREAGPARFDAIAAEAGVTASFIRKFVYGSRENPRVQTVQPLLDFFQSVDRGERGLPEPLNAEPAAQEVAHG
ncbi:hypothetical protein [Pseudacidovorax intermedius]|uniref:hypothetical protein n=1 Tax=Pseudacidovorax intermedius TaxID=433924 RepID=UPI0026EC75E8|nr:hypothetical protein [Pseudacidovorax intermedius]